jgi:hypothetical protein
MLRVRPLMNHELLAVVEEWLASLENRLPRKSLF